MQQNESELAAILSVPANLTETTFKTKPLPLTMASKLAVEALRSFTELVDQTKTATSAGQTSIEVNDSNLNIDQALESIESLAVELTRNLTAIDEIISGEQVSGLLGERLDCGYALEKKLKELLPGNIKTITEELSALSDCILEGELSSYQVRLLNSVVNHYSNSSLSDGATGLTEPLWYVNTSDTAANAQISLFETYISAAHFFKALGYAADYPQDELPFDRASVDQRFPVDVSLAPDKLVEQCIDYFVSELAAGSEPVDACITLHQTLFDFQQYLSQGDDTPLLIQSIRESAEPIIFYPDTDLTERALEDFKLRAGASRGFEELMVRIPVVTKGRHNVIPSSETPEIKFDHWELANGYLEEAIHLQQNLAQHQAVFGQQSQQPEASGIKGREDCFFLHLSVSRLFQEYAISGSDKLRQSFAFDQSRTAEADVLGQMVELYQKYDLPLIKLHNPLYDGHQEKRADFVQWLKSKSIIE